MTDLESMWMSQDDMAFQRMTSLHRKRVNELIGGSPPLTKSDNGLFVIHLFPKECLAAKSRFSATQLKEHCGTNMSFGRRSGNARFNIDGVVYSSGSDPIRAYSQLFRDGHLEAAMSDIVYTGDGVPVLRTSEREQMPFRVLDAYLKFCQNSGLGPPVWLFAAFADCNGARVPTNWRFHDFSERAIDRSPAFLPEFEIKSFDINCVSFLQPFCDAIWQAAGVERSLNFDEEGNWHEPQ